VHNDQDGYVIGRGAARLSRPAAFAVVAAAYVAAGAAAWVVAVRMPAGPPIGAALAADVAATLVIFALSVVFANASLYDPYWSVAPPVIAVAWALWSGGHGVGVRQVVVLLLVTAWAVRLTGNWAVGWHGLGQEDWRYVQLRANRGRVPWWVVNLGGIQLMPTLVVFAGMVSVWPAVTAGGRDFGLLDVLATVVTAGAVTLEATADLQMRRFSADPAHQGRVCEDGLWRVVRHPNYLGEIGFWWGLWLFALAAAPRWWPALGGPLVMVVLFVAASVPLMDKRSLSRRPGYADYMRRVPALLPTPSSVRDSLGDPKTQP
jgi:steroid 5-alpha reductase family enzyme